MWNVMQEIIGRKSEIQILKKILSSNDAEFLALYGRRRVGKTYLVRTFFRESSYTFAKKGRNELVISEVVENIRNVV